VQTSGIVPAHIQQGAFVGWLNWGGRLEWFGLCFRRMLFHLICIFRFLGLSSLISLTTTFEQTKEIAKKHSPNCQSDCNNWIL
jgi:hypothetical protein